MSSKNNVNNFIIRKNFEKNMKIFSNNKINRMHGIKIFFKFWKRLKYNLSDVVIDKINK